MEKSAKANGFEVVYFEKYAIGTLDHSATLSQMKSLGPQWIFITGYINDLLLVRKQMVDQQMKAPVVTMIAGPAYQEFIEQAGQSAENVTSASWWHPAEQYDGKDIFGSTSNFVKLFKEKYKSEPDYGQASAALCGALFQIAIERAGSLDREKVRDELAKLDMVTFFGPVKFGSNGQINSLEPPVFQIQGAKPVVLFPQAINLIHGSFIVLGSYLAWGLYQSLKIPPWYVLIVAAPLFFILGYLLQRLLLNRVITAPVLVTLTLTFGLDLILNNAMIYFFKADYRKLTLSPPIGSVSLFDVVLPVDRLIGPASDLGLTLGRYLLLRRLWVGRSSVAVRLDIAARVLTGVDSRARYA